MSKYLLCESEFHHLISMWNLEIHFWIISNVQNLNRQDMHKMIKLHHEPNRDLYISDYYFMNIFQLSYGGLKCIQIMHI